MPPNDRVLFGIGLENGVHQVSDMLRHARVAEEAGLDLVSVTDHPYFADRLDAYAALGFVLGATSSITGAVIMTNLLSRSAPYSPGPSPDYRRSQAVGSSSDWVRAGCRRRSSPSASLAYRPPAGYVRWKKRSWW
jgi:Luciferase-like monooxygenase